MKKRILSLLLAVITVFIVIPWGVLPIMAEGTDETGLSIEDMEVGKLYSAVFDYSEYVDTYLYKQEEGGPFEEYETTVMKNELPQDLIVMLVEEGAYYLYITNEDWPTKHEPYRFVDHNELIILGEYVAPVTVTYNGQPVDEITLYEDGKMPLVAAQPEEVTGSVIWAWEILVDPASNTWATVYDKTTNVCDVTYALVLNVLDENGCAKVRAVAMQGGDEYKSSPITVRMKYAPKPMDTTYQNLSTGVAPAAASESGNPTPLVATRSRNSGIMLLAAGDTSTERITITVNFIKVRPDGTQAQAAYPDIRTLKIGYDAYTVTLPAVLGYYPSMTAPSNPYDFAKNPAKDASFTSVSIPEGKTADENINVYYYPGEAKYTVYHYIKNVYDDNYTQYGDPITNTGTVDKAVPDCQIEITGFHHLYYEHADVAADGSTVIEIYYDREYFAVLFDLVKEGAYGQENLYVQYGTVVGINDPKCAGWNFSSWTVKEDEKGNYSDLAAGVTNKIEIKSAVTYQANWVGVATTYSVVYWLENANDGNYSIWHTETKNSTSGHYEKWDGVIPSAVKSKEEYNFVTLNTTKTNEEMLKKSNEGVLIEGDGSSTVNVFFNRRTYIINFNAVADESFTHDHTNTNDPCQFNAIYCTDPKHTTHVHTDACGAISCGITEHKHTPECCDTHVHGVQCYSNDADMLESLKPILQQTISDAVKEKHKNDKFFGFSVGDFVSYIVNSTTNESSTQAATDVAATLSSAAPPQNLQNGYVYVLTNVKVHYEGSGRIFGIFPISDSGDVYIDVPAIYIDNGNDDKTDDWYYYNGQLNDGEIQEADSCDLPYHDHTSGCTYGTKCTLTEHVHVNTCYASCTDTAAQHTATCYGYVCSIPVYDSTANATVIRLQAKYGQDITAYLPYYLELYAYGLHKDGEANFRGWKYAGTGWADTGETRYVKHVTMVEELCYSQGVTATAVYDATATNAYVLYYLFESFDQTSGAKDFALDGTARQQLNGTWYDADPTHIQLVMWPTAGGLVDGGQKVIDGVTFIDTTDNPMRRTLNLTIGTITTETLNAYFYGRNEVTSVLHNGGDVILRVPTGSKPNPLKYGFSLGDFAAALKGSSDYGNFDMENVPYPDSLEAGAYIFNGWYTTPYQSEYTKVDFTTDTFPVGELNLYALWDPITRYVEVYEDATLSTRFDNHGEQAVGHRSYAVEPDYTLSSYAKNSYRFNGWFYVDPATGEETAFLFNFPVTQDLKIYAKWTSQQVVNYRINYVTKVDGVYVPVANSLVGTAIAGQNKTFRALGGSSLYADYQEGFFPQVGSHTVQMLYTKDETGNVLVNEYNFVYDEVEEVSYWVKYVDAKNGEELIATVKNETRKAGVTELFVPIDGYSVDQYSKSLILSSTDQATNNVITFYYTENEEETIVTAPWVINHLIQNADGTYSVYKYESGSGQVLADHSDIYYGTVLTDITGYSFAKADVETRELQNGSVVSVTIPQESLQYIEQGGAKKYGYELNEYGMEINLYYDRVNVSYTVQYKDVNTGELFYSYVVESENSVPHGDTVTVDLDQQQHMKIVLNEGCQLTDESTQRSLTLYIDESRNVIVFYYQTFQSTFVYQIVCDDADSGVGLSMSRETIDAGSDGVLSGVTPYESANYYFAGWYADEACTTPVVAGTHAVTLVDNHLTPIKTQFTYTDDNGQETSGNLYLGTTYYALFLPRSANLTVKVTSGQNDAFILTLTGKEGTLAAGMTFSVAVQDGVAKTITNVPVGTYIVTADANWSWRYGAISQEVAVVVKDGGSIEINVSPDANSKWLDGSGYDQTLYPTN